MPPANDDLANAQVITGDGIGVGGWSGSVTGSNIGATLEPGEPESGFGLKTIWYRWTAPRAGTFIGRAYGDAGTNLFDVWIHMFAGAGYWPHLVDLTGNWLSGDPRIQIPVAAGQTYSIRLASRYAANPYGFGIFPQEGYITLTYEFDPGDPPANNNFDDAQVLTGEEGVVEGTTFDATPEIGEWGEPSFRPKRSVWYRWTAPSTRRKQFVAGSSSFYPTVEAFTRPGGGPLVPVTSVAGFISRGVQFDALVSHTYWIRVSAGESGVVVLNWWNLGSPGWAIGGGR